MSDLNNTSNIFVVIPAFNEQIMIRQVAEEVLSYGYRLIVVDDGSVPSLKKTVKGLPIYFLRHRVNLGQGAALQTGIEFANLRDAHYVVTFDADGQHKPGDIAAILSPLQNNSADIVTGSRFMQGSKHNMSKGRNLMVRVARYMNYLFTGLLLTDAHNGLRAMNKHAATSIEFRENGMAHATELLSIIKSKGLRHTEVPVTIHYSAYSKAKGQNVWSSFRVFFDLLLNKIFK